MPCYQINTMTVAFNMKSVDSLRSVAYKLGVGHSFNESAQLFTIGQLTLDLHNQKATIRDYDQSFLNHVKRTYSEAVLEKIAKKKRWILTKNNRNHYQVKRY